MCDDKITLTKKPKQTGKKCKAISTLGMKKMTSHFREVKHPEPPDPKKTGNTPEEENIQQIDLNKNKMIFNIFLFLLIFLNLDLIGFNLYCADVLLSVYN